MADEAAPGVLPRPATGTAGDRRRPATAPRVPGPPAGAPREERGEDLRLAYVALTRARHQAMIWWAGSYASRRLAAGAARVRSRIRRVTCAQTGPRCLPTRRRWRALADRAPAPARRSASSGHGSARLRAGSARPRRAGELARAVLGRRIDGRWRRTSYSDITAAAHDAWIASEPEDPALDDETTPELSDPGELGELGELGEVGEVGEHVLPLANMPAGARVGTVVHSALAAIDFSAADLHEELDGALRDAGWLESRGLRDREHAVAGLAAAIETPLGTQAGLPALRSWRRADRLDELEFELPLAGGEHAHGEVGARGDRAAPAGLASGRRPACRLCRAARRSVAARRSTRLPDREHRPRAARERSTGQPARYAIADYKTNRLAPADVELTAASQPVRAGRRDAPHTIGCRRSLRGRAAPLSALARAGIRPECDLAGVHYLFLRGMLGARAPVIGGAAWACSRGTRRGRWWPRSAICSTAEARARGERGRMCSQSAHPPHTRVAHNLRALEGLFDRRGMPDMEALREVDAVAERKRRVAALSTPSAIVCLSSPWRSARATRSRAGRCGRRCSR